MPSSEPVPIKKLRAVPQDSTKRLIERFVNAKTDELPMMPYSTTTTCLAGGLRAANLPERASTQTPQRPWSPCSRIWPASRSCGCTGSYKSKTVRG